MRILDRILDQAAKLLETRQKAMTFTKLQAELKGIREENIYLCDRLTHAQIERDELKRQGEFYQPKLHSAWDQLGTIRQLLDGQISILRPIPDENYREAEAVRKMLFYLFQRGISLPVHE